MASRLFVGLGVLFMLVIVAGVLLFTVGRDAANHAVADWLVRQATNDEEYALIFLIGRLHEESSEHPIFACASDKAEARTSWDAAALASAVGLPAGEWNVDETGESRDGAFYVVIVDTTGGPGPRTQFDWREIDIQGSTLTCAVPL